MTFEDYLISKKIDILKFKSADKELFDAWHKLFNEVSPQSFTLQKKFYINPIRRKYLLKE